MPTTLEQLIPVYHFRERHSRWIAAGQEEVWQALTHLTSGQLTLTRSLMAIRHLGRRSPASSRPLFTDGPITILDTTAPTYAIGGAIARPWQVRPDKQQDITTVEAFVAFCEPGWVKYLTDFLLEPENDGTRLSTETRGYSTDDRSRRLFRIYWTLIRPGSGIVRRDMLAATARDAERSPARQSASHIARQ